MKDDGERKPVGPWFKDADRIETSERQPLVPVKMFGRHHTGFPVAGGDYGSKRIWNCCNQPENSLGCRGSDSEEVRYHPGFYVACSTFLCCLPCCCTFDCINCGFYVCSCGEKQALLPFPGTYSCCWGGRRSAGCVSGLHPDNRITDTSEFRFEVQVVLDSTDKCPIIEMIHENESGSLGNEVLEIERKEIVIEGGKEKEREKAKEKEKEKEKEEDRGNDNSLTIIEEEPTPRPVNVRPSALSSLNYSSENINSLKSLPPPSPTNSTTKFSFSKSPTKKAVHIPINRDEIDSDDDDDDDVNDGDKGDGDDVAVPPPLPRPFPRPNSAPEPVEEDVKKKPEKPKKPSKV